MNIILITIDTLRADHLGAYGYPRPTSPRIDGLAHQGARFENVVVAMPATGPSHLSLLTSTHARDHGMTQNAVPWPAAPQRWPSLLKRQGYVTGASMSVWFFDRSFDVQRDFDEFYDQIGPAGERTASEVTKDALAFIDRQVSDRPFFLWAHYYDPHMNYTPPRPFDTAFRGTPSPRPASLTPDQQRQVELYDGEIRYADDGVGQIVDTLTRKGLLDRTLVVVTSDHGEQLGEHGRFGGHQDIYQETARVPLIIRGPGVPAGAVVDGLVSQLDVRPTVMALAGLPDTAADGRSRKTELATRTPRGSTTTPTVIAGYPSYTESLAVTNGPWKYILNVDTGTSLRRGAYVPYRPGSDTGDFAVDLMREIRSPWLLTTLDSTGRPVSAREAARFPLHIVDDRTDGGVLLLRVLPESLVKAQNRKFVTACIVARADAKHPSRVSVGINRGTTVGFSRVDGAVVALTQEWSRVCFATSLNYSDLLGDFAFYVSPTPPVTSATGSVEIRSAILLPGRGTSAIPDQRMQFVPPLYGQTIRNTRLCDELYDLRVDPTEDRNLIDGTSCRPPTGDAGGALRDLRRALQKWLAIVPRAGAQELRDEIKERLRSLGYIQ